MTLKRLKNNPKIPEKVIESLSKEIVNKNIKIGQELPSEIEMAKMLGVSRGSLREGLAILEFLGVIISKGRKKVMARDANKIKNILNLLKLSINKDIIYDFIEFRRVMDTFIAELACKRANKRDLRELEKTVNELKKNPDNKKADFQFHINLSRASHNTFFAAMEELLIYMFGTIREKASMVPGRKDQIVKEHEDIFIAIKERDSSLARRRVKTHLKNIEEILKTISSQFTNNNK